MSKKILIDAFYPEETKFILLDSDGKLEEFDYQNSYKKSIKGNIYLGKVSRIEPSLQAAFVEYGNEKKGFLPLEMIHPKYYQIPVADKEQLIEKIKEFRNIEESGEAGGTEAPSKNNGDVYKNKELYNSYKIQEVIKKDQILLVQVEKEERGTKGAFMTTYISLSGRYCVFSPNSIKQGCGISRKLDDQEERERLRDLADGLLANHQNASVILRTACAYRTKAEIQRDFEYLTATWEKVKNSAISSYAPALIYEEGDLIINGIKDFYTSEVEKIIVSGHEAYEQVHEFLKVFIPKNIEKLEEHTSSSPILHEYNIESQLQELYSNKVKLKSGGYLVINTTEALIAIDVNSGTYTDEYSIENTALNINLEAAAEIIKQVKFRGLSGLIVIDFIDMMNLQNKKLVEKALKKAFWQDRVKVQLGKISEFGLLEMSRQRIGRSFVESNSINCPTCSGKGKVALKSSIALLLIGKLKFLLSKKQIKHANIFASTDVVVYLMNDHKRELLSLETLHDAKINLYIDDLLAPEEYKITFGKFKHAEIKNRRYKMPVTTSSDHEEEEAKIVEKEEMFKPSEIVEKPGGQQTKSFKTNKIVRKYRGHNTSNKTFDRKPNAKDGANHQQHKTKSTSASPSILKKFWTKIID
ncbi:Rne/Rng family ribonuclease [Candidatus Bandiella euplotis]|uniref:Ribonuclease G n=1 Tax=Candidatus Bandiella euplotis TaxID=1664265 RepID=A0ABZ0UNS1_9RICK|nr:Rne/Rng family ribonuclease [Candidatus Bandiella woodruffii]WPX97187.1 Rne/Rng family ribonuclease [Candidatus Bandiella woodruffii]